ncbi:hypothetical protein [Alkalibacillus salilacus]|uniref:Uncharacterized protein n=1 Tax=Alkalibacillus salilacus TaxID=284582 RepID=A0ABT9VD37_9BACI|nr:hypothetical protein [Alkalibacillus salilacus]MDQ0158891.1 hypothetical protein [Alkalibacillus salilacus]
MVAKLYLNQNFNPSQQHSFVKTDTQKEHSHTNQLKINRLLLLMQSVFQQLFALNEHAIRSDANQDQLQQNILQLIEKTKQIDLKSSNHFGHISHQLMRHDAKLDKLSGLTNQLIKQENQINNQLETLMAKQNEAIHKLDSVTNTLIDQDNLINNQLDEVLHKIDCAANQLNKTSQVQIEMDNHIKDLEYLQRILLDEQDQTNYTIKTYYHQVIEQLNRLIDSNQTSLIYLLQKLNPGTPLTTVTVNGDSISVRLFVHINQDTNLATFVDADRQLLIADASDINAIQLKAVS